MHGGAMQTSRFVIQGSTYPEQWKVRRLVIRKDQDRSLFLLVPMGKPMVAGIKAEVQPGHSD